MGAVNRAFTSFEFFATHPLRLALRGVPLDAEKIAPLIDRPAQNAEDERIC